MLFNKIRLVSMAIMFFLGALIIAGCGTTTWKPFPPDTFQESDVIGVWEVEYGSSRVDKLILKTGGIYKQVYYDSDGYTYESPWNNFYVEFLPDGTTYLRLEGMRYYRDGRKIAEREGLDALGTPHFFYDSYRKDFIKMLNKSILRVGIDPVTGDLVLIQMVYDRDSNPIAFRQIE